MQIVELFFVPKTFECDASNRVQLSVADSPDIAERYRIVGFSINSGFSEEVHREISIRREGHRAFGQSRFPVDARPCRTAMPSATNTPPMVVKLQLPSLRHGAIEPLNQE